MNFFGLSPGELLLLGLVAMIVLGPEKLPEVAASAGKWIREFRRATEELTSQFADENPFTEIQKALSLDELLAPTVISTLPDAPAPVAPPVVETPTTVASPAIPMPTVPERVKSYHFFGTPNHPGLDPEWIVGVPVREEVAAPAEISAAEDEWLHGVPVLPEEVAATSDGANLDQILTTTSELQGDDAVVELSGSNGHGNAASLEELSVEATVTEAASEEATAASASGADAVADAVPDGTEPAPMQMDEGRAALEASETARGDETLILDPAPEVRREEARPEPAFVGGDAKGRTSEEHQP